MTVKYIKLINSNLGQQATEAEAVAKKSTKTIVRKLPYKSSLCNRKRHKKNK